MACPGRPFHVWRVFAHAAKDFPPEDWVWEFWRTYDNLWTARNSISFEEELIGAGHYIWRVTDAGGATFFVEGPSWAMGEGVFEAICALPLPAEPPPF